MHKAFLGWRCLTAACPKAQNNATLGLDVSFASGHACTRDACTVQAGPGGLYTVAYIFYPEHCLVLVRT